MPPGGVRAPSLARFDRDGVSFLYPASWRAYTWPVTSTVSEPIVYLSTASQTSPCVTTGSATVCGAPLKHLEPSGVLIWWFTSSPDWIGRIPGVHTKIGGRPATLYSGTPNDMLDLGCKRLGGQREITALVTAAVDANNVGSAFAVSACFRGPNIAANQRRVEALLASTSFHD